MLMKKSFSKAFRDQFKTRTCEFFLHPCINSIQGNHCLVWVNNPVLYTFLRLLSNYEWIFIPLWKIKDDHFYTETIHQIISKVFDRQDPSAGDLGLLHFPSLCPDSLKQESAVFKLFELIL